MKKIIALVFCLSLFYSCLNNDNDINFEFDLLPIDEATVPTSFTFGDIDTISVKYTLPNGCYGFNNIYYEYQDTTRTVAVRVLKRLDINCTQATIQEEHKFLIKVSQTEDYVFKFWKGKNSSGENIFDEVIVPVN